MAIDRRLMRQSHTINNDAYRPLGEIFFGYYTYFPLHVLNWTLMSSLRCRNRYFNWNSNSQDLISLIVHLPTNCIQYYRHHLYQLQQENSWFSDPSPAIWTAHETFSICCWVFLPCPLFSRTSPLPIEIDFKCSCFRELWPVLNIPDIIRWRPEPGSKQTTTTIPRETTVACDRISSHLSLICGRLVGRE